MVRIGDAARDPLRDARWAQVHAARSYLKHLENPDVIVLVAERDGAVVGMYVHPPGRGHGVGSRLVTAFTANRQAIRFYTRHGFQPLETTFAVDLKGAR